MTRLILAALALIAGGIMLAPLRHDTVLASARPLHPGRMPEADRLKLLADALDAIKAREIDAAQANQARMDALDRAITDWAMAMSGNSAVSAAAIAVVMAQQADWPGQETLSANLERALLRESGTPQSLISAFSGRQPKSLSVRFALAKAQMANGAQTEAMALIAPVWRQELLDPASEAAILKEFGTILTKADHAARMEHLLFARRSSAASRVAAFAQQEALQAGWAAANRGAENAGTLLDAVAEPDRHGGWHFARALQLRKSGRLREAAADLAAVPPGYGEAGRLMEERLLLARALLDAGEGRLAYDTVAVKAAGGANDLDAAFLAGWIALRMLKEPALAERQFARMAADAELPQSQSRASYWQGRAAEADGDPLAEEHYRRAAQHVTSFYGQLAAAKLGHIAIRLSIPPISAEDRARFKARLPVMALKRLEAAGEAGRAAQFYAKLAETLTAPGELALLAETAESGPGHFQALKTAKAAARRGLAIGGLAHPFGAIPEDAALTGAGKALAYAVARQESEFNAGAVSDAGARGLLQLLPGTARDMARKRGLPFSAERLTSDAGYNATLGSAYLGDQLDRFDGSYVLTLAGYNAGPGRAAQWVKTLGDPRGRTLDEVIDWIERIPFAETRNYVQRVMENYQTYKIRLGGQLSIADDLVKGR